MLRTFSRLATPGLSDLTIEWEGKARAEMLPAAIPPVFDGDAMTLYARWPGGDIPTRVTLRGMTSAGPLEWSVLLSPGSDYKQMIPTLWARRMIQSLEESRDDRAIARERCIELSKRFGLVCPYTSFIAEEHRSLEDRNDGRPATRRVAVQIPRGWHGIEVDTAGAAVAAAPALHCMGTGIFKALETRCTRWTQFKELGERLLGGSNSSAPDASMPAPSSGVGDRQDLERASLTLFLQKQQADGSFEWLEGLASEGARDAVRAAERWVRGQLNVSGSKVPDRVVSTIAVMILLHGTFSAQQALWKRAGEKAVRYLASALAMTHAAVRAEIEQCAKA